MDEHGAPLHTPQWFRDEKSRAILQRVTHAFSHASARKSGRMVFPRKTVKRIMRAHPDVGMISGEAVLVASAAVELFLREVALRAYYRAAAAARRTTTPEDIARALEEMPFCDFLLELLPPSLLGARQ